jgi:hypothetical protein
MSLGRHRDMVLLDLLPPIDSFVRTRSFPS